MPGAATLRVMTLENEPAAAGLPGAIEPVQNNHETP